MLAVIVGLVIFGILSMLDRDDEAPDPVASPATTEQAAPTTTTPIEGPQVPPIDGCTLLESSDIDAALGIVDPTAISGYLSFSGGEACSWQPMIDGEAIPGLSVQVGPGDPADFEADASLDGVAGTETTGIGLLAAWFGEGSDGVLSVVDETPVGYLFMRVALARPDLSQDELLEISRGLAQTAMENIEPDPPIEADLCDLVTDEEAEALLAPHREGRAAARDPLFVLDDFPETVDLTREDDFSCQKLILTEIYVTVESGNPADFEPGADREGIEGQPVDGVGDEARWFPGVPVTGSFASPHETGVLAVRHGDARFRIVLSLPDIEPTEQLAIARELATHAVLRLGGDVILVRPDLPQPDLSEAGFVDNLLAREAAGEWTLGEGLVETLRLFVGETDASDVLVHEELADNSGTGIIALAGEYLDDGDDEQAKTEIARLLDILVFIDDPVPFPEADRDLTLALGDIYFWSDVLAQEEDEGDRGYAPPPGDDEIPDEPLAPYEPPDENEAPDPAIFDQCSNSEPVLPGWEPSAYAPDGVGPWKFVAFFPEEGLEGGWSRGTHLLWALEALTDSLDTYGPLRAPCIQLLFSHHGGSFTYVLDTQSYGQCAVAINRPMQNRNADDFRQQLAADLAHCVIPYNYPKHFGTASYLNRRWWNHALAEYMSNVVYPSVNLEHRLTPTLAAQELSVSLVDRTAANWPFFQYLWLEGGYEAVDGLIKALPASTLGLDHEEFLAGLDGMNEFILRFTQRLSDVSLEDSGGGVIPYSPRSDPVPISGRFISFEEPEPFAPIRLHVQIQPGMYACMKHDKTSGVLASFRSGAPGPGGGWENLPEEKMPYSGEMVVVITSVTPDQTLTLEVVDVGETDDCEEEEEETEPTDPFDPNCVCGPTDYYKNREQLPDDLQDTLP